MTPAKIIQDFTAILQRRHGLSRNVLRYLRRVAVAYLRDGRSLGWALAQAAEHARIVAS